MLQALAGLLQDDEAARFVEGLRSIEHDVRAGTIEWDPELEDIANGGFNPNSTPNPGAPTFGQDNQFYIGALDFVVRVSRAHSVWFDTQGLSQFAGAVIDPPARVT